MDLATTEGSAEAPSKDKQHSPETTPCCGPKQQTTCCAPEEKTECCGPAKATGTCGCR